MKTFLLLLALLASAATASAQVGTITGRVVDAESRDVLPGVNVLVQGTTLGGATDLEGEFSIAVSPGTYTVYTSYIGYLRSQQVVTVAAGRTVEIELELKPDLLGLEEVLVVGFGTTSELARTGSVSRVGEEDLEDAVVNSFEQALQGRISGVTIQTNNGKLGQGIQVRVRGASSVSASNDPLYVVDGIPVTTDNLSSNASQTNPLAQLNPNDIASIEVLKDAAASAIYGARASNGVVLITTKSGFNGKTQFTVDLRRSSSEPTNKPEFLNAEEYVTLLLEAAENSERIDGPFYVGFVESTFDDLALGTDWRQALDGNAIVDENWQDRAFQTGESTELNISMRGGNAATRFFASGSVSDNTGILITDEFERLSGRLNLDHTLSTRAEIGANLSLARVNNRRLSSDNGFSTPLQLIAQAPISPAFMPDAAALADGRYVPTDELNTETLYFNGLLYNPDNVRFKVITFRAIGNAFAQYELLDGLRFRSEFGIDLLDQNEDQFYSSAVDDNSGGNRGLGFNSWARVVNYNLNNYLAYDNTFANRHNVGVTVGTSYQDVAIDATSVTGQKFPSDDFTQVDGAAEITAGTSTQTGYRFLGYFGRLNYDLASRYFLSVSGRYDGSSRFGRNNRYGFFPAAAVGWVLSEEAGVRNVPGLSFLKLRGSVGQTGNAEVGNFSSLGLWSESNLGGTPAIIPTQIENADLKWERTTQYNVGLDFNLFGDRISGEADLYLKQTEDLLLGINLPGTSGFTTQLQNIGNLENKGFDLLINSRILSTRDLTWTGLFNFSVNRNELTDLDEQVIQGGFINRAIEGEPIGAFFGFEYAGVDRETGDALYFVNEMDDNGNVIDSGATTNDPNEANQVVIGDPHPDFTGGFGTRVAYRGFELDVLFQFVEGSQVYDGGGRFKTANGDFFDNQLRDQLDRWRAPDLDANGNPIPGTGNVDTDVPEARLFFGNGTAQSSRYLYDASYMRLRTLSLSYTLPAKFTQRYTVQNARVYLIGTNLLTWTDYPWWDPEVNSDFVAGNIGLGNEFYSAPQARSLTAGVQFTF